VISDSPQRSQRAQRERQRRALATKRYRIHKKKRFGFSAKPWTE